MSTISYASISKKKKFSALQESVLKCVERVFGVLLKPWGVIAQQSRLWYRNDMQIVVQAFAIVHNTLVEHGKNSFIMNVIGRIRRSLLSAIEHSKSIPVDLVSIEDHFNELPETFIPNIYQSAKSNSERVRLLNALVDHIDKYMWQEIVRALSFATEGT